MSSITPLSMLFKSYMHSQFKENLFIHRVAPPNNPNVNNSGSVGPVIAVGN